MLEPVLAELATVELAAAELSFGSGADMSLPLHHRQLITSANRFEVDRVPSVFIGLLIELSYRNRSFAESLSNTTVISIKLWLSFHNRAVISTG